MTDIQEMQDVWEYLLDNAIATNDEIILVTNLNGYTLDTLNDILYVRTGLRGIE